MKDEFDRLEVTVFPDESMKPPPGEGLNRLAEITLERVWPIDKATKTPIKVESQSYIISC